MRSRPVHPRRFDLRYVLMMYALWWIVFHHAVALRPQLGITRVQSKELQGLSLASGSTITYTSNVTAGNLLVLLASQDQVANRQISAVSDNLNGSWAMAKRQGTAGTNAQSEVWYFANTVGGACTITITWANGTDQKDFLALEYSGCATVSPVDVTDGITGASNTNQTYATNSDTTSSNGSVILGVSSLNGSNTGYSSTSGFTQISSASVNTTFAEQIATGAVTTNGSYTITNPRNFVGVMVSFMAPAAAGNILQPRILQVYGFHT